MTNFTAYNNCNDEIIRLILAKAVTAYESAMEVIDLDKVQYQVFIGKFETATECLSCLVVESIYEIRREIKSDCKERHMVEERAKAEAQKATDLKQVRKLWDAMRSDAFVKVLGNTFMFSAKRESATVNVYNELVCDFLALDAVKGFIDATECKVETYPHGMFTTVTMVRFSF